MKWWPSEPARGDMIRVSLGSVYHYGIFVDENTVVQFGPPPGTQDYGNGKDLKVCVTGAEYFSCGRIVETAVLDKKEERKRIPPEKTVETALSRVGEGGYDLIHYNCEHFAYECVFGVRRCTQEEDARRRWNSRPVLDCYFAVIPENVAVGHVVPEERDALIASADNERLRTERFYVWELLGAALSRSFGLRLEDLDLHREACGRWVCGKAWLSLSHSGGIAAVAVSNAPVGIDVLSVGSFRERYVSPAAAASALLTRKEQKLPGAADEETLIRYLTRKESIFKSLGKKGFHPDRITADTPDTVSLRLDELPEHIVSVHGAKAGALRCYIYADGRTASAAFGEIGTGSL